jgi:glycosyltransferase involved in cell wall biosynthesis
VALLIGRGSIAFAAQLVRRHSALAGRLRACGEVTAAMAGAHLQSCDLLVQPYPDGVSTRRTSLMAGLALGVPAVTTSGFATEPIWAEEGLVSLVPAADTAALVAAAERLLANPQDSSELGARARVGYTRHFSIENTVRTLRGVPAGHRNGTGVVCGQR